MATNAERQVAFKAKMRQAGKKQIAIWVDPAQEAAIAAFLAGTDPLPVTSSPSRPIRLPASRAERGKNAILAKPGGSKMTNYGKRTRQKSGPGARLGQKTFGDRGMAEHTWIHRFWRDAERLSEKFLIR